MQQQRKCIAERENKENCWRLNARCIFPSEILIVLFDRRMKFKNFLNVMQKDMHCWNCTRFILLTNMEEVGGWLC